MTVKDTLTSIQRQNYQSFEHLIIDGLSKDNTISVVKAFNPSLRVLSEPDNGIYDAMNKGIQLASGSIIGILNSDDFYADTTVLSRVALCFEQEHCDMVYGDLKYVNDRNTHKVVRRWKAGPWNKASFRHGWMPPHPTLFVRKEVYQEYGMFNTDLRFSADYEFMIRTMYCSTDLKIAYIPNYLVHMRVGGASNASLKNRLLANKEDRSAWRLNGINPPFYTTLLKPLRKMHQFLNL